MTSADIHNIVANGGKKRSAAVEEGTRATARKAVKREDGVKPSFAATPGNLPPPPALRADRTDIDDGSSFSATQVKAKSKEADKKSSATLGVSSSSSSSQMRSDEVKQKPKTKLELCMDSDSD